MESFKDNLDDGILTGNINDINFKLQAIWHRGLYMDRTHELEKKEKKPRWINIPSKFSKNEKQTFSTNRRWCSTPSMVVKYFLNCSTQLKVHKGLSIMSISRYLIQSFCLRYQRRCRMTGFHKCYTKNSKVFKTN